MATTTTTQGRRGFSKVNAGLWTLQVLLAALFLFAGGFKLAASSAMLAKGGVLPVGFLRFIGLAECLGALGLLLPGLLRVRVALTPLAAALLVPIMIGATIVSLPMGASAAIVPAVTGLLCVLVAWGRHSRSPLRSRQQANARVVPAGESGAAHHAA